MKKTDHHRILRALNYYLVFFLLVSFVITCCMMLFLSTLSESLKVTFTDAHLNTAARLTFGNVLLLSFLFTIFDMIRLKYTVSQPVKKITNAAQKIMQGDFSVRIEKINGVYGEENFNPIIDCFNKMAEELSGTETLRTDFIANVSHELKTPLAIMQNYGTMLQQPDLPEEKRILYAKSVTETCRRLASLITNVLKLNKLENQQLFPSANKYNLSEQLCQCLLQFEDVWEKKKIDISTEIEDDIQISSDAELLELVWNNLLSNAFKFTENGGTVSVSLTADKKDAVVSISDTGCGMSPEVGAHIFEKFYQGDTSHATQGNGLGLALVRRVVDIMQGEIGVESIKGKGSTFTVRIRRNHHEGLENNC